MSRARHAKGGGVGGGVGATNDPKPKVENYGGGDSRVAKEANERKRGGKAPMAVGGKASKHLRLDRRGRKRGGSVGADSSPLTSAANLTKPEGGGSDTMGDHD